MAAVDALHLHAVIARALGVPESQVSDELTYASIPEWDSIGQMAIIAELEATYGIELVPEDILAISSVADVRSVLVRSGVVA